jgi:hypothetical protein
LHQNAAHLSRSQTFCIASTSKSISKYLRHHSASKWRLQRQFVGVYVCDKSAWTQIRANRLVHRTSGNVAGKAVASLPRMPQIGQVVAIAKTCTTAEGPASGVCEL